MFVQFTKAVQVTAILEDGWKSECGLLVRANGIWSKVMSYLSCQNGSKVDLIEVFLGA